MPIVTTFRPLCWVGWVFGWGTKCSKSYNPGGTGEPVLFFVAGCPLQGGFRQLCVELGWTVVVISLCGFGLGLGALALPRMPQQGFTAIEIRALYGLADAFIEVNETSCGLRGACDRLRGVRASVLESCQCRKLLRFPLPPNFEVSQVLLLRGAELELEAFPSRCARFEVMGR